MLEPDGRETEILDEADVSWIVLISTDFRPLYVSISEVAGSSDICEL